MILLLFIYGLLFSQIVLICLKQWDNSEDRLGLIGLGFAAVVALWASANLITVIFRARTFECYGQ